MTCRFGLRQRLAGNDEMERISSVYHTKARTETGQCRATRSIRASYVGDPGFVVGARTGGAIAALSLDNRFRYLRLG